MKLKTLIYLSLITLVASLGPAAHAQTFNVIHTFTGQGWDGSRPYAGVTLRAGSVYGTTAYGGIYGRGVVYQLAPKNSQWVYSSLYSFTGGSDGSEPLAAVSIGPNGAFYGTTIAGGVGDGTVYKLTPPISLCKTAACSWKETVLHTFFGPDGGFPKYGNLIFDQAGNIYGTASEGGTYGGGVAFELEQPGGQLDILHNFGGGNDGSDLEGGLVFDSAGNLYGTTYSGGSLNSYCATGCGTVYQLVPQNGVWLENVFSFDFLNGTAPMSTLSIDTEGNLYGTSLYPEDSGGQIFEMTKQLNISALYLWGPLCEPKSGVTMDAAGNLYGVCYQGGNGNGSVYKLTNGRLTDLYDFTGGADGCLPFGPVSIDSSGNLYGTALGCGAGIGVVWEITP